MAIRVQIKNRPQAVGTHAICAATLSGNLRLVLHMPAYYILRSKTYLCQIKFANFS